MQDGAANEGCLKAFLGSFAEVSAWILFSGQLPTGRSVEPEVQVKQQQTINGSGVIKNLFAGKLKHFVHAKYNFLYNYYSIINENKHRMC